MASLAITRKKPHPLFSPPRTPKQTLSSLRTTTTGRLQISTSTSNSPVSRTKILETFKEDFEIGSRLITIETGKIARFANGAVTLSIDDTNVLSTVCSAKGDVVRHFLPRTVRMFWN